MPSSPAHHLRRVFSSRSATELDTIAHVKRFVERFTADDRFRDALRSAGDAAPDLAAGCGIAIDPRVLRPLWLPETGEIDAGQWPEAAAYVRFASELANHRALTRAYGGGDSVPLEYRQWRRRQIARCTSEIPSSAEYITHAVAAFELSSGCSKGCWFCGVSAQKFAGNFPYDSAGRTLWRDILHATYDIFGEASQTAFCYWATDPSDHPDYLSFVQDFAEITGAAPESTTAAPLQDPALVRGLMRLARERPAAPVRFSVTSLRSLNAIHAAFDARELLDVQMICQNRESLNVVANAGRAREASSDPSNVRMKRLREEHATIACVSGLLVNMVARTVTLISPTRASERWPLGYRIHEQRHFQGADGFRTAVEAMIDLHMPIAVDTLASLSFRNDLTLAPRSGDHPGVFRLQSRSAAHEIKGPPYLSTVGQLIAQGGQNLRSLQAQLFAHGISREAVSGVVQHLFEQGFLDDEPI